MRRLPVDRGGASRAAERARRPVRRVAVIVVIVGLRGVAVSRLYLPMRGRSADRLSGPRLNPASSPSCGSHQGLATVVSGLYLLRGSEKAIRSNFFSIFLDARPTGVRDTRRSAGRGGSVLCRPARWAVPLFGGVVAGEPGTDVRRPARWTAPISHSAGRQRANTVDTAGSTCQSRRRDALGTVPDAPAHAERSGSVPAAGEASGGVGRVLHGVAAAPRAPSRPRPAAEASRTGGPLRRSATSWR